MIVIMILLDSIDMIFDNIFLLKNFTNKYYGLSINVQSCFANKVVLKSYKL